MSRKARFNVTLSQAVPAGESVSLHYQTVNGTAVSPDDYTNTSGTLIYGPGEQSKFVDVVVRDLDIIVNSDEAFTLAISNIVASEGITATVSPPGYGTAIIPGNADVSTLYLDRFVSMWDMIHTPDNGYIGFDDPSLLSGAQFEAKYWYPYHASKKDSLILIEDRLMNNSIHYSRQYTSENIAFLNGLRYWRDVIIGDLWQYDSQSNTGNGPGIYNNITYSLYFSKDLPYQGSPTNNPNDGGVVRDYNRYMPEPGNLISWPITPDEDLLKVGDNPLLNVWNASDQAGMFYTYPTDPVFGPTISGIPLNLLTDSDSDSLNTETRGRYESVFQTTIPVYNGRPRGDNTTEYSDSPASFLFTTMDILNWTNRENVGAGYSYTKVRNNPIADLACVHWDMFTRNAKRKFNALNEYSYVHYDKSVLNSLGMNLFDRFFHEVGNNQSAWRYEGNSQYSPELGLINMYYETQYIVYQGDDTIAPASTLLGSSDCHHAMQNLYATDTLAFGTADDNINMSASIQDRFASALSRQIVLLRWLQSPEGPFAGGVTNSHNGNYTTPTDGRENATFCGMTYTYAPGKVNPPSNDLVEWQVIGHLGTVDYFYERAWHNDQTVAPQLEIIMDHFVRWFMNNTQVTQTTFTVPIKLKWTSDTQIEGQTASEPNTEGQFEFLPTVTVDDPANFTDIQSSFWSASSVPNSNLHCSITQSGEDVGVASALAYMLIGYAAAKKERGKLFTAIPGMTQTPADAVDLALAIIDCIWNNYRDDTGINETKVCTEYNKIHSSLVIPGEFSAWSVFYNDIAGSAKFFDIRQILKTDPRWAEVEAYANNSGPAPTFTFHRTWVQCMYAMACAKYHHHFIDPPVHPV